MMTMPVSKKNLASAKWRGRRQGFLSMRAEAEVYLARHKR